MKLYINTKDTETYPIDMGKMVVEYRKKLKRSQRGVQIFDAYDPNEPRDPVGKWTAGGGSSRQQNPQRTTSFVSPNEDPDNLSFEQAVTGLKTPRQKLLAGISHSIDTALGITDVRVNSVVGAWADGAENSVMTNSASVDPDIEEAAAAMKGFLANQKAVLLFHPDDDGHNFLAQFRVPHNNLAEIHKKLLDSGVIFHTLEPRGNDTIVHFYGESREDVDQFDKAAQSFGAVVDAQPGHGKFIPPEVKQDGTDAEQRAASRQAYQDTISRVEATGKLASSFRSDWQNHIDNWERETGERIGGGAKSAPGGEPKPARGTDQVTSDEYDPSEPRDPEGKWTATGGIASGSAKVSKSESSLPEPPGTVPVAKGYVRLFHQTSEENLESIRKNGITLRNAKTVGEGVSAIWADEHGFYGKPTDIPTVEFEVPKERWRAPEVKGDVKPEEIIAIHLPWHERARTLEKDKRLVDEIVAGEHDDITGDPDAEKIVQYIKQKYGEQQVPQKKTKDWRFLHVHTIDRVYKFILRTKDAPRAFREQEHPRGQPENAGEFVSKGQGAAHTPSPTAPAAAKKQNTPAPQAPTAPKAAKPPKAPVETKTDTTTPLKGSKGHPGLVSSVVPSDKRAHGEYRQPNTAYMKTDEKQYKTNIAVFDNPVMYPLPKETFHGSDDDVSRNIIDHIKSNLKFIFNNTPEAERNRTRQWYDGARKMVDRKVEQYKEYNIKDTTVAGLYATLSPINLWDQNVRQADQMLDVYCKQQDTVWDAKMEEVTKTETWKTGEMKELADLARGKKFKDIKDVTRKNGKVISAARIKGHWIRAYDMAHNTNGTWNNKELGYQPFHAVTPEGDYKEWYLTDAGNPQKFSWHTPDFMEKAVKILDADGNRDVISANLGGKHKVRSFYNNILDPNSDNNDVTMDTHAIDAAWMMDAPAAVFHNFGNAPPEGKVPYGWERGTAGSVESGVEGTYAFYGDAYREMAKELGIRPRELQSIVWETKRKWMGNMTPAELTAVAHLWKNYQEGRITGGIEAAQTRVKQMIDQSAQNRLAKQTAPAPEKPYRYRSTPIWTPSSKTDPYEYAYMPEKTKGKKGETPPKEAKPQQMPSSTDPDPYDEYEIYRAELEKKRQEKQKKEASKEKKKPTPKPPPRSRAPEDYEYGR